MIQIISPHIDDAMLSLGGSILNWRNQNKKVKIIYVFTRSNWTNPGAISGLRYPKNIKKITALRKSEEMDIQKIVKADVEFLDIDEDPLRNKWIKKLFGYDEKNLINRLKKILKDKIDKKHPCFIPLAVDKWFHNDHLIIRKIGLDLMKKGYNISFYEDLLYISHDQQKTNKGNFFKDIRLIPKLEEIDINKKMDLLRLYRSQMSIAWLNEVEAYAFSLKDNKNYERYWKPE